MARQLLENLEALSQNVPALTNAIDKLSNSLADQQSKTKELADQQEAYNRAIQETTVEYQRLSEEEKKIIALERELRDEIAKGAAANAQKINNLKEQLRFKNEVRQETKELAEAEKEAAAAAKSLADALGGLGGGLFQTITGIKSGSNALSRFYEQQLENAKQGKETASITDVLSQAFNREALAIKGVALGFNIADAVYSKFVESTSKAFLMSQELGDSLGRQLGLIQDTSGAYGLLRLAQSSNDANVSFQALGEAAAQLQTATQGIFGNIVTTRPELALFSNEMVGLGVETQTTADLFGKFGRILGRDSVNDIKKLEKEAIKMARTFGLSSDAVIKDIAEMSVSLAQFGDRTDEVALDIAKIAGAAKISSSSIVGFGKSFEFFPDAINNANELNLIFQRNVVDGQKLFMMMNDGTKGPGEAFRYFITQIGPALDEAFFQSPDRIRGFNQTLAQFGVTEADAAKLARDIVEANKQGRSLTQVLDERQSKISANAKALKSFSNLTKELTKLQEAFAISMGPVVDKLTSMVQAINSLNPETIRVLAGMLGGGAGGAALGFVFGGLPGALALGAAGAALGGITAGAIGDGVITSSGGQTTVTKIDSQDDLKIVAAKPGGPISRMGSSSGVGTAEIVVSLFGEELVRKMVDLVDAEQGKRKEINSIIQGAA